LWLLPVGALAAAPEPQIPYEKYTLNNGLTVILSQDHRLPQVAVNVWYHVGAANQSPGKSGFAHLFEHMMFSGAKHIGPEPLRVLEHLGAGNLANGSTNFDRTNYWEIVPSNQLPGALWLESDRMGFLLDTLNPEKLTRQRDVVSNERRQSYENRPYGAAELALCDTLYPRPHPYYDCVIGTISEIQGASMEDLKDFFRRYYAPTNAALVIAGDFDPATAKALVEKYFGPLPPGPKVEHPEVPQPMLEKEVNLTVHDKVAGAPRLTIAWNGVKPFAADEPAGDILGMVLGEGRTSRLYRGLVFDRHLAAGVDAGNGAFGLGGYFDVNVTVREGHTVAEVKPVVQGILDDVKKNGITDEELNRAKRNLLAGALRGLQTLGGRAEQLNHYEMWTHDPGYLAKDLARYRGVTRDQVQAFAQKYLPDNRRLVMDVEPGHGGQP
jgi:predicted Zn-dependent peptidase